MVHGRNSLKGPLAIKVLPIHSAPMSSFANLVRFKLIKHVGMSTNKNLIRTLRAIFDAVCMGVVTPRLCSALVCVHICIVSPLSAE